MKRYLHDTAVTKEYLNNEDPNSRQRHREPKRDALRGFIKLLLILCCCLAVMTVAIGLAKSAQVAADGASNADDTAWYLILVNKWHAIPSDYAVELKELSNGQSVDMRIYPALQEMFDTARSNGVYPVVVAGYRTAEKQQSLLDAKFAEYKAEGFSADEAKTKAEAWVALPGTSEHQLGISVDVGADEARSTDSEVEEWFKQNSYKFGFIYRYASDKTEITGVIDEPWHYRYVGVDAATEIHNHGICLEEYLNKTG